MNEILLPLGYLAVFVIAIIITPALVYANWGIPILIRHMRQKRNVRKHP